jgi:hypothetical protein
MVTTGNWLWCAIVKGLDFLSKRAIAESGIGDEANAVEEAVPEELEEG